MAARTVAIRLPKGKCPYRSVALGVCNTLSAVAKCVRLVHVAVELQLRSPMIEVMQTVVTWCYMQNISCEIVSAYTWRKRVGVKSQGSWAKNKKHSIEHVRNCLGYFLTDHNQAESLMISLGAAYLVYPAQV